jgi:hypothetical protein
MDERIIYLSFRAKKIVSLYKIKIAEQKIEAEK